MARHVKAKQKEDEMMKMGMKKNDVKIKKTLKKREERKKQLPSPMSVSKHWADIEDFKTIFVSVSNR